MRFDRIKLNHWILQHSGTLYPWKFLSGSGGTTTAGLPAVSSTNTFHLAAFQIQLAFFTLYALYIQWTFVEHSINQGIDPGRYHMFGMHHVRSMFAMTFTYFGYAFCAHSDEHKLLYNFIQNSPGKILNSKLKFQLFQAHINLWSHIAIR